MLFFGGIFYGTNALFPVLQNELIFADLCPNKTDPSGCTAQINIYTNALTTYTVVMMVMLLLIGILIDYIGLRVIKLASALVYFIGMIMFAFVTPSTSPLIFVGGSLAAVGGMGTFVCLLSVSQLFTKSAVVILAFITGSYDASSTVFAILKLTYDAGLSLKASFLILAFCGLVLGINSALFILSYRLPDMSKYKKGYDYNVDIAEVDQDSEDISASSKTMDEFLGGTISKIVVVEDGSMTADAVLEGLYPTRGKSLKSLPFIIATTYFSLALLRFTFFLGELTPASYDHFNDSNIASRIGSILSYSLAGGIIAGLLCGTVIDQLRSAFKPKINYILSLEPNEERNIALQWLKLLPMAISMYIVATLALIISCLVFIGNETVYYVNFFFLVLFRGFIFSTFSSSIMAAFPIAQFGTLYGVGGSIAGAFSCLQYALLVPTPKVGNIIALVIAVLIFLPPTFILLKSLITMKRLRQK